MLRPLALVTWILQLRLSEHYEYWIVLYLSSVACLEYKVKLLLSTDK
jgi:hypothetical protein